MSPLVSALVLLLAGGGQTPAGSGSVRISEFIESGVPGAAGPLVSTAQYSDEPLFRPARRNEGSGLFSGPNLLSVVIGASALPLIGGGAADDSSPHLAPYKEYWSFGAGLQAELHLHALPAADVFVSIGIVHHPSTGANNWTTSLGSSEVLIRYRFDPLYLIPIEFGGKVYLKVSPRGVQFVDSGRNEPMLYARIGAGPVIVTQTGFSYDRWVDGVYQGSADNVWWPSQSVLGLHVAVGLELGNLRGEKSGGLGLFIEAGYRYMTAPVVTEFTDTSGPIQALVFTLGAHLP